MVKNLKKYFKQLFCGHHNTKTTMMYTDDHFSHVYTETCEDCGKQLTKITHESNNHT